MSVSVIDIKEFKEKIKMYIPHHELSNVPRIGDVEGQSFECGCGESHIMNFDQHYFIADGGLYKAVFLSPDCGYLNALKLKKMLSKGIENLFSTKYLVNEPNYGFDSHPDIAGSIDKYFGR
jgi:hypothetical protein